MLGRYSFQLPELPGGLRPLRDKDAADDEGCGEAVRHHRLVVVVIN